MTTGKALNRKLIAVAVAAASTMAANARSLIHYVDFDTLSGSGLAYTDVDKGTSPADFTFKQNGTAYAPYTSGALGSDHAFYSSSGTSLWLGDGSASLGCGTTRGFTLSFWCKLSDSHTAWTDFFGFRVGGRSYRFEYSASNNSKFTIYSSTEDLRNPDTGAALYYSGATANVWHNFTIVATPNGTNSIGTCALFIDGGKVGDVALRADGDLQQINVGTWQRQGNGNDNKTGLNNTGIDELAVFDYPATAEQVKWLAKYKPAQPASGPGRAMPICWLLDTGGDSTGGVQPTNYGTGTDVAYKWDTSYANWVSVGAFGSTRAFHMNSKATFRVDGASAVDGLGAMLGSGMTLSFWLKAPGAMASLWSDFMAFRIGNRFERFEWDVSNPLGFHIYGTSGGCSDPRAVLLTADTWQHVCMVWNEETSRFEFYLDGEKQGHYVQLNSASADEALKTFTVGPKSFTNSGADYQTGGRDETYVDEVAIFNHSLSTNQISWLGTHVPCLPPLDATNLVRTIPASGKWAGGLASWTVREWDDTEGAWANTTRTAIYPALEDTEVEVAVTLADGVVITNDTFVTPKKLVLATGGTPVVPVATLKSTADSRFAPEALEIGDGLQLTVPLYAVNVGGTLTLGANSKITFDVSNYDGIGDIALVTDGIVLPAGETDALAHFAVTDARFVLSLPADGKTVYARLDNVAATATWTGAGDGTSLGSAANWECRNGSGTVLPDALPCELTRVIICSGSTALNAPAGTTIPWQYLRIEAGNATLAADTVDWCGIPLLDVPEGVTVNVNGKKLYVNGKMEGNGTITSSVADGELHVSVPEGVATTNAAVLCAGSLRLVKDGDGTFVAARESQTYAGGTEIADGTLRLGTNKFPLGPKNASVKICAGALYDMAGYINTSSCIYAYDLAGTIRNSTPTSANGWDNAYRILGGTFVLSGDARAELSNVYFACPDTTPAMFTMNGYTLTFDGTGYVGLGGFRSSDYGKWVFTGNCNYEWLNGYGPSKVDVEVYAPAYFKLKGNADIKGLVYEGTLWAKNNLVSHLLVFGRYLAGPCHPPINMRNGSTLDLSAITGSFDLTNAVANTSAASSGVIGDMTFESGTAETPTVVNVNLAGKTDLIEIKNSESPYVVTWLSQPMNVDFVLDAQSHADGYRIYPEAGGLRLKRYTGVMILVR